MGQGGIFLSKKPPIFYSAILLTVVNLLLRFVSTSFQVYISGKIGASGVGLLQLVLSVGGMAMTAGIAGIRTATMYLTAAELGRKKPENICHILSGCILYSIVCSGTIGLILYIASPVIAESWIGNVQIVPALRLLAIFLPISCLCGVMAGYFTAAGRIGTLVIVEVAEQLFSMTVTMTALNLWAGFDPGKACISVVCGSGAGAGLTLCLLFILRILEKAPKGSPFPLRKRLLNAAIPLTIADDFKAGINTAENLMVPKRLALFHSNADPLALFGTVCAMVFPILMFPASIVFSLAELMIPEMARCHAAGSQHRIQYLTRRSLRIVMIYGCLFCGVLYFLADGLCIRLYQSPEAGFHLSVYAFLAPMLYCDIIVDAMNKGLGQQKISVQYNIITALLDVIFLYLLLPEYGMTGYFISFLITHLLNFVLSFRLLIKTAKTKVCPHIAMLTVLSTTASIFLASLMNNPILQCISFVLLYGSMLTLFGIIGRKDVQWLKGIILNK